MAAQTQTHPKAALGLCSGFFSLLIVRVYVCTPMIAYMCVCVGCVLMNSYFGLSTGTYMCRHTFGSQRTTLGVSPHIFFCDTVYCFATEYPGLAVSHLPPGTLGLQMNDTTPSLMCIWTSNLRSLLT